MIRKRSAAGMAPSAETAAIHDLTNQQGAGILLFSANGLVLLGLRGMEGSFPHTWAPFGGMVDPGEVPIAAAKREIWEEAGVAYFTYQLLDEEPLYVNHDEETGFQFHTFAAVCPQEMAVTINKESLGFGWFNPVRLPRELHPGFQEMMQNSEVFQRLGLYRDMLPAYANTKPR